MSANVFDVDRGRIVEIARKDPGGFVMILLESSQTATELQTYINVFVPTQERFYNNNTQALSKMILFTEKVRANK